MLGKHSIHLGDKPQAHPRVHLLPFRLLSSLGLQHVCQETLEDHLLPSCFLINFITSDVRSFPTHPFTPQTLAEDRSCAEHWGVNRRRAVISASRGKAHGTIESEFRYNKLLVANPKHLIVSRIPTKVPTCPLAYPQPPAFERWLCFESICLTLCLSASLTRL